MQDEPDSTNWQILDNERSWRGDAPLAYHPYANIFPLLKGAEFDDLVADIAANGLLELITVDARNQILDGRNRYRACLQSGVKPLFEPYTGDDPLGFVISRNLRRRHLDESQRDMVAARIATLKQGGQTNPPNGGFSQSDAAAALNVSVRGVQRGTKVLNSGNEALIQSVDDGKIPVSVAANLADAPAEVQQRAIDDPKIAHMVAKQARRAAREVELAEATERARERLGTLQLFSVICADPPWRFEPWSEAGMDRAADNHYPTVTIKDLMAMKPPAAKNSVLYLWGTVPMLWEAMLLIQKWGYIYKSHCVWHKDKIGTGYWFRDLHELLLVATRGDVPAPAPGTQPPSVIPGPVTQHSVKPDCFYDMIEGLYPNQDWLEMFARGEPRDGWAQWGNETQTAYHTMKVSDPEYDVPEPSDTPAPIIDWTVEEQVGDQLGVEGYRLEGERHVQLAAEPMGQGRL